MHLYPTFFKRIDSITYSKTKEMDKNRERRKEKQIQWEKNFFYKNVLFCVSPKAEPETRIWMHVPTWEVIQGNRKSQHKELHWGHCCRQHV